ncbi:MAG: N-acetyltransferase GCN5 [Candidatus Curtissbacteria bacterium GW2011_GWA1_40_9]|uniref:N-acetyltransferase GCN5 n=1 Tax=Candidatus Curtissbacteria bacterium GW2011_GWA1_40_9 TaxID=1618408 RepID=A0A0G0W1T1_9BACT|nr:MAG: N-acetyltransferase GCN5 [Candidatus Curtissbacteria bacterium GW2011_GWA1_40_9]
MLEMQIRTATPTDIDTILALQTQIYRTEKVAESAKETLEKQLQDETCQILVAQENSRIIGTGTIYYIEVATRARPYAFLEGFVVDQKLRGKGIGTSLLQEVIKIARYKNCYKIIFTSGDDRQEARKLYEKLGFKRWGVEFRMDL